MPERSGVVAGANGDDVADGAVLEDTPHGLLDARIVSPAQSRNDGESFLVGELARFDDAAHARRVDGDRLFDERMFAGRDGIGQVLRPKVGRLGKQHDVDAAVDDLLVGVESGEHAVGCNLHLVLHAFEPAQLAEAVLGDVGERVANRHEHVFGMCRQRILGGRRAAEPGADQADSERFVARRVDGAGNCHAPTSDAPATTPVDALRKSLRDAVTF